VPQGDASGAVATQDRGHVKPTPIEQESAEHEVDGHEMSVGYAAPLIFRHAVVRLNWHNPLKHLPFGSPEESVQVVVGKA